MVLSAPTTCRRCGRTQADEALVCATCGQLMRHETAAIGKTVFAPPAIHDVDRDDSSHAQRRARIEPWFFLALGLATAPVFALTPILGFMGWFLASLVHEMGHAALAWFCGMPALPAISLSGHAAAIHSDQVPLFVAFVAALLAFGAWKMLEGRARWIALALIATIYPLIALTGVKELLHLLAGHAGELAFATLALWKTLDGGFTNSRLERALYGTVGWFLVGKNAFLCFGLMTQQSARDHYHQSGSFGLQNDLIRVANDVLGWPLQGVAFCMLVACVMVLPAAILVWRARLRAAE
jgi:hypothetical protein